MQQLKVFACYGTGDLLDRGGKEFNNGSRNCNGGYVVSLQFSPNC